MTPPGGPPPPGAVSELDLDLLSTVARIEQIDREGADTCGGLILHRLITCDAPRLYGHVSKAARDWLEAG